MPVRNEPKKSTFTTTGGDEPPGCAWCPPRSASQQFRAHLHWLRDFRSVDDLKKHLAEMLRPSPGYPEVQRERIESLSTWWRGVQEDFRRTMELHGVELEAWEAWCMAQASPACATRMELHARLATAGLMRGPVMWGATPTSTHDHDEGV